MTLARSSQPFLDGTDFTQIDAIWQLIAGNRSDGGHVTPCCIKARQLFAGVCSRRIPGWLVDGSDKRNEAQMTISSIGNGLMAQLYATAQVSNTRAKGATSDPSAQPATSGASTVTLSDEAQSMAALNAMGVTVQILSGPGLSEGVQPAAPPGGAIGPLSQASFQQVLESYGATASEAQAIFASADQDHNGSISNGEMLGAMDSTTNSVNATAQRLLQLMDTNHDGTVSGTEYVTMETSIVQAHSS
jgi:hypothetical protein